MGPVGRRVVDYYRTQLTILSVGEKLPGERTVAAELGVGRTSIREALVTLMAEGRIVARHGRGYIKVNHGLDPVVADAAKAAGVDRLKLRELVPHANPKPTKILPRSASQARRRARRKAEAIEAARSASEAARLAAEAESAASEAASRPDEPGMTPERT